MTAAVQIFVNGAQVPTQGTPHVAHVNEDPTVISHCPFCGSGGISGRSDGGADCDLCGRTFTVMEQPLFSNTPAAGGGASVPVTPFDPLTQETPFADGAAGSGTVPGEDPPAAPGEDPAGAEAPPAPGAAPEADPAADPDDGKPAFLSSLRSQNDTRLSVDDFVMHHAVRAVTE